MKLGATAPAWTVSAAAWALMPKPHAATTPMIPPRVRNQFFRAIGLKESETLRNEGKALRKCDTKLLLDIVITLYNTKTERVPRYSNSPSINLWNCPSPIRYTVKPIDSYKTSGQDAFLVRETQGGSHAVFEQVGTRPRPSRSKVRDSDHWVAQQF